MKKYGIFVHPGKELTIPLGRHEQIFQLLEQQSAKSILTLISVGSNMTY